MKLVKTGLGASILAIAILLTPVAGRTSSRRTCPGWEGQRSLFLIAAYSAMSLSSVVLLEVDAVGIAILEFESDAPRSVDVNREADRVETLKGVEVETR